MATLTPTSIMLEPPTDMILKYDRKLTITTPISGSSQGRFNSYSSQNGLDPTSKVRRYWGFDIHVESTDGAEVMVMVRDDTSGLRGQRSVRHVAPNASEIGETIMAAIAQLRLTEEE